MPAIDLAPFDVVVFDPPRQGAEAQAREIAKSKVKSVVAVSCNAATFARDAAILIGGGYKLTRVTPVDQFKYTAHVEIGGAFRAVTFAHRVPGAEAAAQRALQNAGPIVQAA